MKSSNRTFMELKCSQVLKHTTILLSSNRTFMELKFILQQLHNLITFVLIVPLWN